MLLGLLLSVSSADALRAPSSAQETPDAQLEGYFAHAASALARHQAARARIFLRRAVARAPGDARGVLRLGALTLPTTLPGTPLSDSVRRDVDEVRAAIAVALGPTAVQDASTALLLRRMDAWAQAVRGDLDEAVQNASRSCGRLDDETAQMLRTIARYAVQRDALALADRALDGARRCSAASIDAVWELAIVRLARGQTAEAVTLLREVVQRQPGDINALRDLAGALLASGETADSLHLYTDIAAQCPRDARCHLDIARAALESHEFEQAVTAAVRGRDLATASDPEPSLLLGAIQLARGARREAIDAFRDALRREPGNPRAVEGLRNLNDDAASGEMPRTQ